MYNKYFPIKDNTIDKKNNLTNYGYDTDLVICQKNYYSDPTDTILLNENKSRFLIQFDLDDDQKQYILDNINSITANLVLFDNTYQREDINDIRKYEFDIDAFAISQSWDEGQNSEHYVNTSINYSSWDYRQKLTDWSSTSITGSTTSTTGGCWYESISATKYVKGNDNVVLDITSIVKLWLEGTIDNNGLILKFRSEEENFEYYKAFYSRHTHSIFKPYLEISFDDGIYDDRLSFYRSRNQSLYLYNIENEKLTDIGGLSSNLPSFYLGTIDDSSVTGHIDLPASGLTGSISSYVQNFNTFDSDPLIYTSVCADVTATRVSTGIYKVDIIYKGEFSYLYDQWVYSINGTTFYSTGSFEVHNNNATFSIGDIHDQIYRVAIENCRDTYMVSSMINLRVNFYKKMVDQRTLTSMRYDKISTLTVMKDAYMSIVEYDSGYVMLPPIRLNYDGKGNWLDVDTSKFFTNKRYFPIIYYYDNTRLITKKLLDSSFTITQ